MYCIYEIRNKINNKTYIGQHKTNNLNDNYMGSGTLLHKAYEKYGIENFIKTILAITETKENVDVLEKAFIKFFREEGKAEYNIADGGDGLDSETAKKVLNTPEIKFKISKGVSEYRKSKPMSEKQKKHVENLHELMRGKPSARKGCKLSEETKEKIRIARAKQDMSWRKGKPLSEEARKKISESNKGRTFVMSEEHKKKISEGNKKSYENNPERRLKLSNSHKGKYISEETKKKISESNKGKHVVSEETRKKDE